jgi:hypothetical protein
LESGFNRLAADFHFQLFDTAFQVSYTRFDTGGLTVDGTLFLRERLSRKACAQNASRRCDQYALHGFSPAQFEHPKFEAGAGSASRSAAEKN